MAGVQATLVDNGTLAALAAYTNLQGVSAGLLAGARILRTEVTRYPAQSSRPQPFMPPHVRRYVMWAIKNGIINVPYARTYNLAASWAVEPVTPLEVHVGTENAIAPLVQGARQASYHRVTGWEKAGDVARRIEPQIQRAVEEQIGRWIG